MKTIEITTDVMPWANDAPQAIGSVIEADDDVADAIIANGHAKAVAKRRAAASAEKANADV